MNPPIKWSAELRQVLEVALADTSDLTFWQNRLQKDGLVPAESKILLSLLDSGFTGKEWSVREDARMRNRKPTIGKSRRFPVVD